MLMTMMKITTHIMEIQHNRCKECISAEENFDFYMAQTINEVMSYPKNLKIVYCILCLNHLFYQE